MSVDYQEFLSTKRIVAEAFGFEIKPRAIDKRLYDFQRDIVRWSLKRGRSAVFADCGLGKSFIQVEWAKHVSKLGPVLILAPLAVARQTISEARKLDVAVAYVKSPIDIRAGLNITNYERLADFVGRELAGIVCDESSILKSIDGATRDLLLTEFTGIPYRLCCTATPCPNDIAELANHAEFLGVMKRNEMLASFFVHDQDGWRLRGHAAKPFYRWLASWSMALKSPADLGYDASRFILPAGGALADRVAENPKHPPLSKTRVWFWAPNHRDKQRSEKTGDTVKTKSLSKNKRGSWENRDTLARQRVEWIRGGGGMRRPQYCRWTKTGDDPDTEVWAESRWRAVRRWIAGQWVWAVLSLAMALVRSKSLMINCEISDGGIVVRERSILIDNRISDSRGFGIQFGTSMPYAEFLAKEDADGAGFSG